MVHRGEAMSRIFHACSFRRVRIESCSKRHQGVNALWGSGNFQKRVQNEGGCRKQLGRGTSGGRGRFNISYQAGCHKRRRWFKERWEIWHVLRVLVWVVQCEKDGKVVIASCGSICGVGAWMSGRGINISSESMRCKWCGAAKVGFQMVSTMERRIRGTRCWWRKKQRRNGFHLTISERIYSNGVWPKSERCRNTACRGRSRSQRWDKSGDIGRGGRRHNSEQSWYMLGSTRKSFRYWDGNRNRGKKEAWPVSIW